MQTVEDWNNNIFSRPYWNQEKYDFDDLNERYFSC